MDTELRQLAEHYGVAVEFYDWKGRHRLVKAETVVAVLAAMDVAAVTSQQRAVSLQQAQHRRWLTTLPTCTVREAGQPIQVEVHVPAGSQVRVYGVTEAGRRFELRQIDNWEPDREIDGAWLGEASFVIDEVLPTGYHELVAETVAGQVRGALIVTPSRVELPNRLAEQPAWGWATQLYSVAAEKAWGIGDLADLADLLTWSGAQLGAGFVLINPLHAAEPIPPMEPSPYLPTSRRFWNPLYVRPERIAEFSRLTKDERHQIRKLRKRSRNAEGIDRDVTWAAKLAALELIYQTGRPPIRQLALTQFVREQGEGLRRFACWNALCEHFGNDWHDWPPAYRDVDSAEVAAFAESAAERIDFYQWLQWITAEQLALAQFAADRAGMAVGVIADLAVGVNPRGAETWLSPELFAAGVSVGAPADQYNQAGQNWQQPPWRPDRLEKLAYQPLRELVRATLSGVGGVRIDHVMGLFRLWWVPDGQAASEGTYVRYDHEAMVGIIALEAQRAGAVVVGEDLGTVEPWVREYLLSRGILGTSVMWWEKDWAGQPIPPQQWREACLGSVTTHDLPPTLGYLAGEHIRLRAELGVLSEPVEQELLAAAAERSQWVATLLAEGYLAEAEAEDVTEIMLALHRRLAASSAKLRVASLADAVGSIRAQNQPGTIDEYPNWRVPLADSQGQVLSLEQIFAAELPRRLAAAMGGRIQ